MSISDTSGENGSVRRRRLPGRVPRPSSAILSTSVARRRLTLVLPEPLAASLRELIGDRSMNAYIVWLVKSHLERQQARKTRKNRHIADGV